MKASALLLILCTGLASADPGISGGMESSAAAIYTWPADPVKRYVFPIAESDFKIVTSTSGWRVSPFLRVLAYHYGIDIEAVLGAQAVAAADGEVVELWPPPGVWSVDGKYHAGHPVYGGMIILRHGDGTETLYGHLAEVFPWFGRTPDHDGQQVKAGQPIGKIGKTGKAVGIHLHFEILIGGLRVNPLLYVALPVGARKVEP